ncbi:MAG: hypothetical protein FD143_1375 [Ignavibacteria bacterium]|nr:MAG: hypothetical protein FD143_1375 [Ignavibacteria bacterium]KAF0161761.1 MAG: hypothetical protein FD188_566 [Ignavibacteria bacterium]
MKPKRIFLVYFAAASLFFCGCDDTLTNQDLDSKIIPTSNVSFGEYIQPVFRLKCNNTNCHNSQDRAGRLSLDTHADATNNVLVVFPGMPDNSKLVWAIEGRTTSPMPPVGWAPLTKNQINGIRTWINEGAKNN